MPTQRMSTSVRCLFVFGLIFFGVSTVSVAQVEIVIDDPGMESALREALGIPSGPIMDEDLLTLTHLDAENYGIRDITALQYCTNLTNLNLFNNAISDITPLARLVRVSVLDLGRNSISDIGALDLMRSLISLSIWDNHVSDISILANMRLLLNLFLMKNEISDITPLLDLPLLISASLLNNPLSQQAVCNDILTLEANGVTVLYLGECRPGAVEDLDACLAACENLESPDQDGDGLTACQENCYGTSATRVDTDFDGIPDGFEARYGLNPIAFDSHEDPDGDNLINFFEYLRRSDPHDETSPERIVFVSGLNGLDDTDRGGLFRPYATIAYALSQVAATEESRATIFVLEGNYVENLVLKSWVRVAGVLRNVVTIEGTITGTDNATLQNVEVMQPTGVTPICDMTDISMKLDMVVFRGDSTRSATGINVTGSAAGNAIITNCTFLSLMDGIVICGEIPTIRRCVFQNLSGNGIIVQAISKQVTEKGLGDETNPESGWNTFKSSVDGPAVVNQTGQSINMQNNDWDTDDPTQVDAEIDGAGNYQPILAKGNGLLASTVFVSVIERAGQEPVTDATVTLQPSSFQPVTQNEQGVYAFPAVAEGTYTASATLPSEESGTAVARVEAGSIVAVTISIGSGGGAPLCGNCRNCGKLEPQPPGKGDTFVAALALMILLGSRMGFKHRE